MTLDRAVKRLFIGPSGIRAGWSMLLFLIILFAVTIALLLKTFVIQPFFIPSGSMEDTLLIGDKVLVSKFVYHLRAIRRGDIVVFNGAGSWNPPVRPAPASQQVIHDSAGDRSDRNAADSAGGHPTAPTRAAPAVARSCA